MKPRYRNPLIAVLFATPVLVVVAATVSARTALPRLLSQEVEEGMPRLGTFLQDEFSQKKTPAQITEIEKRHWTQAKADLQQGGASEKEADGVLQELHTTFDRAGARAMPVYVKGTSIWGRRVWAITAAWDTPQKLAAGTCRPCRHWTVIVEADPPHREIAEDR